MKRVLRTFHTSFLGLCLLALVFVGSPGCGCCGDGSSGTLDDPGECCCKFLWNAPDDLAGATVEIAVTYMSDSQLTPKIRGGTTAAGQVVSFDVPPDLTVPFSICVSEEAADSNAVLAFEARHALCPAGVCWKAALIYEDNCRPRLELVEGDPDLDFAAGDVCDGPPVECCCCDFEWKGYCFLDDVDVTFTLEDAVPPELITCDSTDAISISGSDPQTSAYHFPPIVGDPVPQWVPFTVCVDKELAMSGASVVVRCTSPQCTWYCPQPVETCWTARLTWNEQCQPDIEILTGLPVIRNAATSECDVTEWCGCLIHMEWSDPSDIIGDELEIRMTPDNPDFRVSHNPTRISAPETVAAGDQVYVRFLVDSNDVSGHAGPGERVLLEAVSTKDGTVVAEAELLFDQQCKPTLTPMDVDPQMTYFTWVYDKDQDCNCVSAGFCD